MKVIAICLIICLGAINAQHNLDGVLRAKMQSSIPGVNWAWCNKMTYNHNIRAVRNGININVKDYATFQNHKATLNVGRTFTIELYKKFSVLKFGTKYEFYKLNEHIYPGGHSTSSLSAYLGKRVGTKMFLRTIFSAAGLNVRPVYRSIRYKKCKKKSGRKKCRWATRNVARGLNNGEMAAVKGRLGYSLHTKAVEALKAYGLASENEETPVDVTPTVFDTEVLSGVANKDVVDAVHHMVGTSTDELKQQVLNMVTFQESGVITHHAKDNKFVISLKKEEGDSAKYNIHLQAF